MKSKILYTICIFLLTATLLSSCNKGEPRTKSPYAVNNFGKASIELIEGSLTPEGIAFAISYSGTNECTTWEWYVVEECIDGSWYSLTANSDMCFTQEAYPVVNDTPKKMENDWSDYYGALPAGTYRILKEIHEITENGENVEYYLALEFEIKE